MKVLVIIPTHDRKEFYHEAIDSVARQTRQADELIVIGNVGPGIITDASLTERLNWAIERSDCDAFLILCDDDKLDPHYIERTSRGMELTGVDIVYTNCSFFGDRTGTGAALGEWTKKNIDDNTVPLITSLCSKAAWARAGGFEDAPFFDWDFWWRCFYTGSTAKWIKEPLFWYRDHAGQTGKSIDWESQRKAMKLRQQEYRNRMSVTV
jgi:hypothetical protein